MFFVLCYAGRNTHTFVLGGVGSEFGYFWHIYSIGLNIKDVLHATNQKHVSHILKPTQIVCTLQTDQIPLLSNPLLQPTFW